MYSNMSSVDPASLCEPCFGDRNLLCSTVCVCVCLQVKDLYQGVMGKLKGLQLQPGWSAVGKTKEGYERLRRQVCVTLT